MTISDEEFKKAWELRNVRWQAKISEGNAKLIGKCYIEIHPYRDNPQYVRIIGVTPNGQQSVYQRVQLHSYEAGPGERVMMSVEISLQDNMDFREFDELENSTPFDRRRWKEITPEVFNQFIEKIVTKIQVPEAKVP